MRIGKPNPSEQRDIVNVLDTIDRKIDLHRQKRAVLDELFKALLQQLMTGEIRVADLDLSALAALGLADGSQMGSKRHGSTIAHTPSRVGTMASYGSESRQVAGEPSCP